MYLNTLQLSTLRKQAEQVMKGNVSFFTLTITRDAYGKETYVSGLVLRTKAYIGAVNGKDTEIVEQLKTSGRLGNRVATMLTPYGISPAYDHLVSVSGGNDWRVVWTNKETTDEYKIYAKTIITRDEPLTHYKDQYGTDA